ncbi:hypothetical protein [Ascidiaceihabitans sp.]|uniref:hypothetical protein n=1 Tax=Ascidiaceihabitans sp. TaxID=1872644 RepID=UPI0032969F19
MFWDDLYSWPGYDFWGVVLAVLGFAASIGFAYRASSQATLAAEAARQSRHSMELADTSNELALVKQLLVEIRLRVEALQWEQVSEKCEAIRLKIAPMTMLGRLDLSEESHKSLIGLQSQMASLQKTADEVRHNNGEFDLVKISSVIAKQGEAVARAIREFKDNTEITSNVE